MAGPSASAAGTGAAPELPLPDLPPGAMARDHLLASQRAIRAGNAGEAQATLGRAETRLLNDACLAAGPNRPLYHPGVAKIEQALEQLGDRDTEAALATVERLLTQR